MAIYLDFECAQQDMRRADSQVVAEGANVLHARFDFCPKWDGLQLYARFKNGAAVYDVPIVDGVAPIPAEVVRFGVFEVSAFGLDGMGGRLTSARALVPVRHGIDLDGVAPIPATQTLLERFEGMVRGCIDIAAGVRADADAGLFNGAPFDVYATFPSVAAMEQDEETPVGAFVVIDAGSAENEENARVYQRSADGWRFIVDMSGAQGAQGVQGIQGERGEKGDKGDAGSAFSGLLGIEEGGTGATTAAQARANLGAAAEGHKHAMGDITSGILPISRGGTGGTTAAAALAALGAFPATGGTIDGDVNVSGNMSANKFTAQYFRVPQGGKFVVDRENPADGSYTIFEARNNAPTLFPFGVAVDTGDTVGANGGAGFTFGEDAIESNKPVRGHFMVCSNANPVTEFAATTSGTALDMTNVMASSGALLTAADKGIKCEVGGYVAVSAVAYFDGCEAWDTAASFVQINRSANGNSNTSAGLHSFITNANGRGSSVNETRIFRVDEGDVVKLLAYNATAKRGNIPASARSVLTVQYV